MNTLPLATSVSFITVTKSEVMSQQDFITIVIRNKQ